MSETPEDREKVLEILLQDTVRGIAGARSGFAADITLEEVGTVVSVSHGVAMVSGLSGVQSDELIRFSGNTFGVALNIDPDHVGVVLVAEDKGLLAGSQATRSGRVLATPVGEAFIGRVVDPLGRPLDSRGGIKSTTMLPVEREAPAIMDREPVTVPLQTGVKVIDALIPVGRGQRELILGDRQTGKTAIALDAIINQKGRGVVCIYCAIGKQAAAVAKVVKDLQAHGAMQHSIVMATTAEEPPGLQFMAPYAATSMGEYFMGLGEDVLVVFDDLTCHARAYRELSLLLRRPPGREAFPGDIFYIHSRLLERFTHLSAALGGGSLTALPIAETEAQNIAGYIPTNLISITDGQIYLCPHLFHKAILPAVDVGKSVSRVGGKSQLSAYRAVAGELRLSYAQFEELEAFSRFGTRLDEETRRVIDRGRRVREVLKQRQYDPIPAPEQIAVLFAVTRGVLDEIPVHNVSAAGRAIEEAITEKLPTLCERICSDEELSPADLQAMFTVAAEASARLKE